MKKFDSQFVYKGTTYPIEWHEVDNFSEVPYENVSQIYGVCFCEGDVVLITSDNKTFNLPGGSIEKGETYDQAFRREIQEETNMEVIGWRPIGYQIVTRPDGTKTWQLRAVAKVRKIGDFENDPAGSVKAIKLCKIEDLNTFINYDLVGERLIQKAKEIKMSEGNIAPVELEKPNPNWSKRFDDAKAEIQKVVGEHIVSIEHIGSTSIPNLSAKPEIDILIGVNRLEDAEKCVEPLQKIGYPYYKRFEEFVPERRYFRKSEGITPLVHVHMYEVESQIYKNHLLFRDYMRTHHEAVKEYENLKWKLAKESGGDRGVYQDGKVEFTTRIVNKAKSDATVQ